MADQPVVDPNGLHISIERGAELQSAELDAALEQLAQAVAALEAPEPIEGEVEGFRYDFKQAGPVKGMTFGDAMGGLPKFDKVETGWCLGRCGANSGDSCTDYCWVEG